MKGSHCLLHTLDIFICPLHSLRGYHHIQQESRVKTAELWGGLALDLSLRYVTLSLFHSAASGNQCANAHKEQSKQSTG